MKMTKEELAQKLNGRKIGEEMSLDDEIDARESSLIVIFGSSDDLAEIRGIINDEVSVYDGNIIPFLNGDLFKKECDNDECPHEEWMLERAYTVKAKWCDGDISWTYETEIPHVTFDILEDDEIYCRGIVFNKSEICGKNL